MKIRLVLLLLCLNQFAFSQNNIEWKEDVTLNLNDFQSTVSKVDSELKTFTCRAALNVDFFYQMSFFQFMFTKEFNSKITATFQKTASYIQAPDSAVASYLLDYSNFAFDLTELYARRFRKELFEKKKFFSRTDFYQPIYKKLVSELNERMAEVSAKSELGKIKSTLIEERKKVQEELLLLQDFCKSCDPNE